jgi:antitoxin component YwqK of YwqJK toxin-antitoxin module
VAYQWLNDVSLYFKTISIRLVKAMPKPKLLLLLIFGLILIMFAFLITEPSEAQVNIDSVRILDNVIFKGDSETPFTGLITDTLDNRIIEYQVAGGLKNGSFTCYYLNGQIAYKGSIVDNKNEGSWTYYFENGRIESTGIFENDKASGTWKWYYPNGSVKEVGSFSNGEKNGVWEKYSLDGRMISIVTFWHGKIVNEVEQYQHKSI